MKIFVLKSSVISKVAFLSILVAFALGILDVFGKLRVFPELLNNILANLGNVICIATDSAVQTWLSSLLLLACSVAAAMAWRLAEKKEKWTRRHFWGIIAAVFLLLSIDEVATIHETLGGNISRIIAGPTAGFLRFNWVIVGAPFAAIFACLAMPFLIGLPRTTRLRFIVAGAVFVLGAVGVEMVNGKIADVSDGSREYGLAYGLLTAFEELLEMMGSGLFLVAIVRHIEMRYGSLGVYVVQDVVSRE